MLFRSPHVIPKNDPATEQLYAAPIPDFSLRFLNLKRGIRKETLEEKGGVLLVTEGELMANGLLIGPGSPAALVNPGIKLTLEAKENSLIFMASGS